MEVSVQGQAAALAGALALGGAVGLLYDGMRILRCRLPLRWLGAALDLLFWLLTTAALFLYAQVAEGGRVRLYLVGALFLGGTVYFCLFSRPVLRIGYFFADRLVEFCRFAVRPIGFVLGILKKVWIFVKNLFLSGTGWYRITATARKTQRRRAGGAKRTGGLRDGQDQEGGTADQDCGVGSAGLPGHCAAQPERANRRRRGRAGRHGKPGGRPDPAQRRPG